MSRLPFQHRSCCCLFAGFAAIDLTFAHANMALIPSSMSGRFHSESTYVVEERPTLDSLYVRVADATCDIRMFGCLVTALRSRNYTHEMNKRIWYWEIAIVENDGIYLLYQAPEQTWLAHAKVSLKTFFAKTGIEPSFAEGLRYLDLEGLVLLGLLRMPEEEEEAESIPERFRLKDKPTCIEPTEADKNWALATGKCKLNVLVARAERLCLRDEQKDLESEDGDEDEIQVRTKPLCHGHHHDFDGILHILKAKTREDRRRRTDPCLTGGCWRIYSTSIPHCLRQRGPINGQRSTAGGLQELERRKQEVLDDT